LIRGGVFRAVRVNLRLQRRGPPIIEVNLGAPGAAAGSWRAIGRWALGIVGDAAVHVHLLQRTGREGALPVLMIL